jgi:hypothetical protein
MSGRKKTQVPSVIVDSVPEPESLNDLEGNMSRIKSRIKGKVK